MHFHIVTLFPEAFRSYLGESILRRSIEGGKVKISFYNPRDFTANKWRRVDRPPYGGGPGLVIEALPVIKAIESALRKARISRSNRRQSKVKIFWLTPSGRQFDNALAARISKKYKHLILICGRYEGIDARVKRIFKAEGLSVGPYVLTGGELPAMVIIDAVARHIPGVLGNIDSLEERRTASAEVYTRPEVISFKGKQYKVPKVLLSGDHAAIEKWKQARKTTLKP